MVFSGPHQPPTMNEEIERLRNALETSRRVIEDHARDNQRLKSELEAERLITQDVLYQDSLAIPGNYARDLERWRMIWRLKAAMPFVWLLGLATGLFLGLIMPRF